jgi:hypothetical protein
VGGQTQCQSLTLRHAVSSLLMRWLSVDSGKVNEAARQFAHLITPGVSEVRQRVFHRVIDWMLQEHTTSCPACQGQRARRQKDALQVVRSERTNQHGQVLRGRVSCLSPTRSMRSAHNVRD